jgi:hemoglobin
MLNYFKPNLTTMEQVNEKITTLYDRLGGEEGITRIVDDVVDAHMQNPAVSVRFLPYREKPEILREIKSHTVSFFGAGSGGPQVYLGRDMPTTHRGMNINEAEYMHVVDDIMKVLGNHGKNEETKKDVLYILYSLKDTIIGK